MIRTVLVAVDASEHAKAAVDLGAGIASACDADLVLLHVVFGGPTPNDLYGKAEQQLDAAMEAGTWQSEHDHWGREHQIQEFAGSIILDEAKERATARGAQRVKAINDYGSTVERILEHAEILSADMIVMGARGTGALQNLFIGSTSHGVLHNAPCTAIAVHHTGGAQDLAAVKRIVVPVDGSEHADKAVALAGELAGKAGAALSLVHVLMRHAPARELEALVDPKKLSEEARETLSRAHRREPGRPTLSDSLSLPELESALKEIGGIILEDAKRNAQDSGAGEIETKLLDGDAAQAIIGTARQQKADLIAMGTRGLGQIKQLFVGSVSYKVTHSAPCTTMMVR